jgi:hypothetical protein
MLPAQAWDGEGDLGQGLAAQDDVGAAVLRRLVADHGEAIVARLELLGLVVLALGRPPPPLLVHVGTMGGVHQADDRVVDMGVEFHAVDELRPAAHHAGKHRRRHVGTRPRSGDRS